MQIAKRYLYPPRPAKGSLPLAKLHSLVRPGHVCQLKLNDKRATFSVENGNIEVYNRHDDTHSYRVSEEIVAEIVDVAGRVGQGWVYLDGGILHGKSRLLRDTIALWDVLVINNDWLIGTTYLTRYNKLLELTTGESFIVDINGTPIDLGLRLSKHLFLPRNYTDHEQVLQIVDAANTAAKWVSGGGGGEPVLEGAVVKRLSGTLEAAFNETNNGAWQSRCRVHTGRHKG